MRLTLLTLLCLLSSKAFAQGLIADISPRKIEIDSNFQGIELLVYGARYDVGDVVVVVRGPETSYLVRKKERVGGIWVNRKTVDFEGVEGFYAMASSRPFDQVEESWLLNQLSIGAPKLEQSEAEFTQAFLRKQQALDLYRSEVTEMSFLAYTLFRSRIWFPETIPRGTYTVDVYLLSDGRLHAVQSIPLNVVKRGLDAFIFDAAYQYPLLYGIVAVLIALISGWLAGLVFRKV